MKRALTAIVLIANLAGCATGWTVDSSVDSFSTIAAVPAGASYRFERLPSQAADSAAQDALEAMAAPALAAVGLQRADAGARYSALVGARVTPTLSPWADPWLVGPAPWGPGLRSGWYGGGFYGGGWYGAGLAGLPQPSNPWYVREVSVVLREVASGQVVYETRARNDGPYSRSADVLPVMFSAALQGFPNPPAGPRRVDIPLGAPQR